MMRRPGVDPIRSVVARAQRLLEVDRPAEALSLLGDAAADSPEDYDVLCLLASCCQRLGRFEEALAAARAATVVRSAAEYPYRLASVVLTQIGQSGAAVDAAYAAVARSPHSWSTHGVLASALAADQQGRAAWLAAQRAVSLAPTEAGAHATMGRVASAIGRPRQARAALREALRLAPLDPGITSDLAALESGLVAPIHSYAIVASVNPGDPMLDERPEASAWGLVWLTTMFVLVVGFAAVYLLGDDHRPPAPVPLRAGFVAGAWLLFGVLAVRLRRKLAGPGQAWLGWFFRRPVIRLVTGALVVAVLALAWIPLADGPQSARVVPIALFGAWAVSTGALLYAGLRWDARRQRRTGDPHGTAGLNEYVRTEAGWAARREAWGLTAIGVALLVPAYIGGLAMLGGDTDPPEPGWVRGLYLAGVAVAVVWLVMRTCRRLTGPALAYLGRFLRRPATVAVLIPVVGGLCTLAALPFLASSRDGALLGLGLTVHLVAMSTAAGAAGLANRRGRQQAGRWASSLAEPWSAKGRPGGNGRRDASSGAGVRRLDTWDRE